MHNYISGGGRYSHVRRPFVCKSCRTYRRLSNITVHIPARITETFKCLLSKHYFLLEVVPEL